VVHIGQMVFVKSTVGIWLENWFAIFEGVFGLLGTSRCFSCFAVSIVRCVSLWVNLNLSDGD